MNPQTPREDVNAGPMLGGIARTLALMGGGLLLAIAGFVTTSVMMRWLLGEGIEGDFEFVQTAAAVVAFCCFPLCIAVRGNIAVDTFSSGLPERWRNRLDAAWDLLFAAICIVLAWRLALGALDQLRSGTTLMISGLNIWWAIGICAALLAVLAATALVVGLRLVRRPT
jgi:TRAP-type C4-dicarboxylate transport system permease small subunit